MNVQRTYDGYGQLLRTIDTTGTTDYQWDIAGRLTSVTNQGKTLGYEYDLYGNLVTMLYPDQTKVSYTYDSRNRMNSMVERDRTHVSYEYDANNNLLTERRSDGLTTTNTYDAMDRTVSTKTTRGEQILAGYTYTYDRSGRMVQEEAQDSLGKLSKEYTYSESGKLIGYEEKKDGTWEKSITYTYDTYGNKTKETTKEAGRADRTVTYVYDDSNRLQEKIENGKQAGSYQYDKDGNLTAKTENGVKTVYTYTTDNRLATTTVNGVLESAVTYDGNGLKSFELLRKEYQADYTREQESLLEKNGEALQEWEKYYRSERTVREIEGEPSEGYIEEQSAGRDYEEFAFRAAYAVGSMAPALWEEWFDFACTFFEDIRSLFSVPGEEAETTVIMGRETKAYANLIEQVAEPEYIRTGTVDSCQETVSFYEPTAYLYDMTASNAQVLAEYAGTSAEARETYTYGAGGRSSGAVAGVYIYDGRGSVSETCQGGKVTNTLRYDPYGTITCGAPLQERIYAYNGEQYTPQTGLIYLRARNYDPATGTFTSRDTYLGDQTNPVTRNRYTYANNNPVMYQDPSGHAGLFSKIVNAVKSTATKVVKTVTKTVSSVANQVKSAVKTVATNVKKAVTTVSKAVSTVVNKAVTTVKSVAKTVVTKTAAVINTAKQAVVKATTVVVNKVKDVATTVVRNVGSAINQVAQTAGTVYNEVKENISEAKETVSRYVDTKVKEVEQKAAEVWEDTKDVLEEGLSYVIEAKETVAECVQKVGVWWEESDLSKKLNETAENLCAAWKNSPIGKTVTAISTQVNKAAQYIGEKWNNSAVGQFCQKAANTVSEFYEKHKVAINIAIGVLAIAACVVAVVATGGMGCCLLATAAKGALAGAFKGAVVGTLGGALNSAVDYMEENGTLDGSGRQILEGASTGFAVGALEGAKDGFIDGATKYLKNPSGYCFIAGTMVLTMVGLASIEDIRPGDYVYAENTETREQAYMPVLETFSHEVSEIYTVTIEGESIETTSGHPFYVVEEGWVGADELEAGDEVELADGGSGTVDSVEKNELDEPVTVYNFAVMDYHTYYVGENGALVHNDCTKPATGGESGINSERIEYYLGKSRNNIDSDTVILGSTGKYDVIAETEGYTYFKMSDDVWASLEKEAGGNYDEIWKVNQQFIDEQIAANKNILLSNDPYKGYYFDDGTKRFYQREIDYILSKGYTFESTGDDLWKAVRK